MAKSVVSVLLCPTFLTVEPNGDFVHAVGQVSSLISRYLVPARLARYSSYITSNILLQLDTFDWRFNILDWLVLLIPI